MVIFGCKSHPNLRLPSLISDNMLLQQKVNTKIWGKATPGTRVSVATSWNSKASAKSGKDGKWIMSIPAPEAGGPYTMTVSAGDTSIVVKNILAGEVWFCSGQSNMEMPVTGWPPNDTIMHSKTAIAGASIPEIRLFNVQKIISGKPLDECTGKWEVCTPETVQQFSATAFFFGRKLHSELNVPVGLIESAWGGTPSESWTSNESLEKAGEFIKEIKAIKESEPLQADYQAWLNTHKQVEVKASGNDQWKELSFNDENVPLPEFNDSSWPVMKIPCQFETVTGEFDGAIWFRKSIEIPAAMAGKDLTLNLGPIDDMDRTYFNGKLVGATEASGMWQADRIYQVPASLVKAGTNIIAVRVLDTQGGGGIYGSPEKLKLTLKKETKVSLTLTGDWKYQPVAEFKGDKFYVYDIASKEFSSRKRPINLSAGTPSVLYNGMVSPVTLYQIKGAIWYQGEANVGRADQYTRIFPAMIRNWREAWGISDFPFYFVQIAPYVYAGADSTESGYLREAQESALALPATGMAVTLDIATVNNIHPPFKTEVGERLAALALNNNYGKKQQVAGPSYKSMIIDGNKITVKFENTGTGLVAKNNKLTEFEIAGHDGKYIKADARIVNGDVEVSSPAVKEPAAVRYCWRNGSQASLFSKEGLPALQFRTK